MLDLVTGFMGRILTWPSGPAPLVLLTQLPYQNQNSATDYRVLTYRINVYIIVVHKITKSEHMSNFYNFILRTDIDATIQSIHQRRFHTTNSYFSVLF